MHGLRRRVRCGVRRGVRLGCGMGCGMAHRTAGFLLTKGFQSFIVLLA